MYFVKHEEAQRRYLDALAVAFPKCIKPDPEDYDSKVIISISRADSYVSVEIMDFPPRLPVELTIGGSVSVNGHDIESDEMKMLVHSIVSDLVSAIDVILPRDKQVISFHPTEQ